MGHTHEALLIVKEISKSATLRKAVYRCHDRIIDAYEMVERFANSSEMKVLRTFRARAAFHYDSQLPINSLKEIAENNPDHISSYSMGTESLDWHFEIGDAVMDRMVIRDIFGARGPRAFCTSLFEMMAIGLMRSISKKRGLWGCEITKTGSGMHGNWMRGASRILVVGGGGATRLTLVSAASIGTGTPRVPVPISAPGKFAHSSWPDSASLVNRV